MCVKDMSFDIMCTSVCSTSIKIDLGTLMKQIFHMHEKVSGGSRFFQMEERKPKNCMKMNKVGPKWGRTQGPPPSGTATESTTSVHSQSLIQT